MRWPSAITASLRSRAGTSSERSLGLRRPHEPHEQQGAAGEERAGHRHHDDQRDQGERVYPPLAFAISAVIAGTTSCRSPITA